ncbi:hypothetical protein D3C81_1036780 [compost metagenome]
MLQGPVIRHAAAVRARDQQLHPAHIQPLIVHVLHERHDQRRRRFEDGDPLPLNPVMQTRRIDPVVLRHNHHRASVVQRPRDISHEHVEREACELQQPHRELIQPIFPPIARRRVHQAAVLDHHALRLARRSRRIDHVRQILWTGFMEAVGIRPLVAVRRFVVEVQHRRQRQFLFAEPGFGTLSQRRLRQQHLRSAVFEHEPHALRRVIRVERHIRPARFPHGQHGHQQVHRTLGENADDRLPADAACTQRSRQAVRPLVQLRIRQPLVLVHDSRLFRRALRLFLEQPVERRHRSHFRLRRVERAENLLFFLYRQQVQLSNLCIRTAYDRRKQMSEMSRQPPDRAFFIKSRCEFKAALQAAVFFRNIHT